MNLQIMVQHLRDEVKELQGTRDALAGSKLREDTLQNQVLGIQITCIVLSHIHNFINTLVLEVSLQGNNTRYLVFIMDPQQLLFLGSVKIKALIQFFPFFILLGSVPPPRYG